MIIPGGEFQEGNYFQDGGGKIPDGYFSLRPAETSPDHLETFGRSRDYFPPPDGPEGSIRSLLRSRNRRRIFSVLSHTERMLSTREAGRRMILNGVPGRHTGIAPGMPDWLLPGNSVTSGCTSPRKKQPILAGILVLPMNYQHSVLSGPLRNEYSNSMKIHCFPAHINRMMLYTKCHFLNSIDDDEIPRSAPGGSQDRSAGTPRPCKEADNPWGFLFHFPEPRSGRHALQSHPIHDPAIRGKRFRTLKTGENSAW